MINKDMLMAIQIAKEVSKCGGRVFLVGGCVRDELLKTPTKDIDIEIHGIETQNLVNILESFGEVQKIGASFGVFNLKGYTLDIAMPRKEKSNGRGHRDFEIFVDPFIGVKEAARRRDFTINSIMKDILTNEIIDPFGGIEDLNNKIIRHVNENAFVEDPLRVFRAAQFAARFDFKIDEKTIELSSNIDLSYLAFERVYEELNKALLKSQRPSIFFEVLRDMNQLSYWFREVEDLIDLPQSKRHHPEGDAWTHTMLVLDEAAKLREEAKNQKALMLSALCHDFGKVAATKIESEDKITAYGHEVYSEEIANQFLDRITHEIKLKKEVLNLVTLHMKPNRMYINSKKKSMMKLWDEAIYPEDLILLAKADHLGRGFLDRDYTEIENILRSSLEEYKALMAKPQVLGRDLVELGLKPNKEFSKILEFAHKLHLSGVSKEEVLRHIKGNIDNLDKLIQ